MRLLFALALCACSLSLFADVIPFTGSGTTYTIQQTGVYQLTAYGAQGGNDTYVGEPGGGGAIVTADFMLTANEVLDIYIGGAGGSAVYGAGGGGTFVFVSGSSSPLLVAGGGGGAGINGAGAGAGLTADGNGTADASGQNAAGTSGGAGAGQGAGSGLNTPCPGSNNQGCGYSTSAEAFSGGDSLFQEGATGGFGGGGGSGDCDPQCVIGLVADGGGGGYNGGGASDSAPGSGSYGGGGGGSYVDSSALSYSFSSTYNAASGQRGDMEPLNGQLDIELVTAPEPASFALLGLGLMMIAIPGVRRIRRSA